MSINAKEKAILKSFTGTYEMSIEKGDVVVRGRGKFSNYVAVFPKWQVDEFLQGDAR